jgi:hypothetical protein
LSFNKSGRPIRSFALTASAKSDFLSIKPQVREIKRQMVFMLHVWIPLHREMKPTGDG